MNKLLFVIVLLAYGLTGFTQTQFIAVKDGDWNANDTWNPNAVPGPTDYVEISNGLAVTIQSTTIAECALLQVGDVSYGVLSILGTLNISEISGLSVTVIHANSDLTVFGTGTLTYKGNVNIVGGFLKVNGIMKYLP